MLNEYIYIFSKGFVGNEENTSIMIFGLLMPVIQTMLRILFLDGIEYTEINNTLIHIATVGFFVGITILLSRIIVNAILDINDIDELIKEELDS